MMDGEILSKVTSIEEDEEDCEDTDEIEDLIQLPTKYEVMQALEVLQTCTFYDADVGDSGGGIIPIYWDTGCAIF